MSDKAEAVMDLIRDGRAERSSLRSFRRIEKAIAALGLDKAERIRVLEFLDYFHAGQPYQWLTLAAAKTPIRKSTPTPMKA